MVSYKCLECGMKVKLEDLEKRFVCPNCGSKVFFKPRVKEKVVKTD